ncbi:MAG: rhomboid family intramembrane serine protease [Gemmatimonadales bacterium]
MTPWVLRLVVANVAMFLVSMRFPAASDWLGFSPRFAPHQPWTIVTYMFLHANLWHLLFNMLALYFFGPMLELRLGGRRFLGLYFVSGLVGALFSFATPAVRIVGASGAVYGVMLGFARYWPRVQVLIWGIIPVEAWLLVIGMTLLALFGGAGWGQPGVAHFAHLGGFAGGLVYLLAAERLSPAARFRARAKAAPKAAAANVVGRWKSINREALHPVNREEFDRVMAKIDDGGVGSLTAEERLFLDRFTPA